MATPYRLLALAEIEEDPTQPRTEENAADDNTLTDLMASIQSRGVLQPILVQKAGASRYRIIAGHRRYKACVKLKLEAIPAIIAEAESAELTLASQIVENIQRQKLSPKDTITSVMRLHTDHKLPVNEIARQLGRSPAWVSQVLSSGRDVLTMEAVQKGLLQDITGAALFSKLPESARETMIDLALKNSTPITRTDIERLRTGLAPKIRPHVSGDDEHRSMKIINEEPHAEFVPPAVEGLTPEGQAPEGSEHPRNGAPRDAPKAIVVGIGTDVLPKQNFGDLNVYHDFSGMWVIRISESRLARVLKKFGVTDKNITDALDTLLADTE